jgi:cell fate (sporulation/competence/biofilm development) regulator YlbF (YheA/YmcA/DUF963 family)
MIPNKELQDLARALTNTSEYTEMLKSRKRILENPVLGKRMMALDREQERIAGSHLSAEAASEQIKKLHAQYKDFLENNDVKAFINAADLCQKMIDDCFDRLNKALEIKQSGSYR